MVTWRVQGASQTMGGFFPILKPTVTASATAAAEATAKQ